MSGRFNGFEFGENGRVDESSDVSVEKNRSCRVLGVDWRLADLHHQCTLEPSEVSKLREMLWQ